MSDDLLEVRDLAVRYGPVRALDGVSLRIGQGSTTAIVGPNGAGKSTLVNALAGLVSPASGEVLLDGVRIDGLRSHKVARLGLALVPEGRRVIAPLTVEENLLVAGDAGTTQGRRAVRDRLEWVYEQFTMLAPRRDQASGQLSGGEQQLLALARALMMQPRILVLDEPSMGLAPIMIAKVYDVLRAVRAASPELGMLVVEQSGELATDLGGAVHMLRQGQIDPTLDPRAFASRHALMAAYIGKKRNHDPGTA